ncbi:unnamed protein product, partial [Ectocarpus sp. 13 AM-2016]
PNACPHPIRSPRDHHPCTPAPTGSTSTPPAAPSTPPTAQAPSSPNTIRNVRNGQSVSITRTTPDSQPIPEERDLPYACRRDNCRVALFLKENTNPQKQVCVPPALHLSLNTQSPAVLPLCLPLFEGQISN